MGSVVVGHGLVAPRACGIFLDRTHVPCIDRQILNPLCQQGNPCSILNYVQKTKLPASEPHLSG